MAYQRPMVTVDQNMTTTPTSIERDQPALIFGPNYELHRFSEANEKEGTYIGLYASEDMEEAYPNVADDEKVDATYTKLFGDNVVVALCDLGSAQLPEDNVQPSLLESNGGYTKLLFAGKAYVDYDQNASAVPLDAESGLKRNLRAGDYLWVSYTLSGNQQTLLTKIEEVQYGSVAWNLDSDSSSEGASGTLVKIEDPLPIGSTAVLASLSSVLNGVEFDRKCYLQAGSWQWKTETFTTPAKYNGVKIFGGNLCALDASYDLTTYYPVKSADLYVTYRELQTGFSDSFHSLYGASEVAKTLGAVDPDNPLAMGVYMAALNAANDDGDEAPPVYFMAVPTDDYNGYAEVLNAATLTERAYVFAPTTQDGAVLELLRNHVLEMSVKTVKKWRIAAASETVPDTVQRLGPSTNLRGTPYYAIPLSTSGTGASAKDSFNQFRIVANGATNAPNEDVNLRSSNKVVEGDVIKFRPHNDAWQEEIWDEYVVTKVINKNTVEVKRRIGTGPIEIPADWTETSGYYGPAQIEAYHVYTDLESAELVASTSRHLATRRMVNVFPPTFETNGVLVTNGSFAACAVAGLISSTEPQQPITNMSIRGIDNVPSIRKYTNSELDVMAAGGTFIVAQDLPDDVVYVRHQITTAYKDGNLNTAELSITKNVDSISYAFADVFRPYYGKYNITPELIAILENLAGQLISQFGGSTSVYGPQLITENTSIRYVRQNALMKDHVDVAIRLGVPYPCNNIDIVLTV